MDVPVTGLGIGPQPPIDVPTDLLPPGLDVSALGPRDTPFNSLASGTTPDHLDTFRETMQRSLDAITNDIGTGLQFPIYITVPTNGNALAMIATPLDPSDQDWEHVRAIINGIIGRGIGCGKLRAQELTCAAANMAPMNAADVAAEQSLSQLAQPAYRR
jgi:hypothetical protein